MRTIKYHTAPFRLFGLSLVWLISVVAADGIAEEKAAETQYNPNFHYFVGGQLPGGRSFTVGDPAKWDVPVTNLAGQSLTKKLTVKPADYQGKGDAMHVEWSKSDKVGQLALYGATPINLTSVKDQAGLVFDVKMHRKPKQHVTVAMDCNWPCRGSFNAQSSFQKMPKDKWVGFAVPLSCLKGDTFDLSKINGVFLISTNGPLEMTIANIRLEKLGEGENKCAE